MNDQLLLPAADRPERKRGGNPNWIADGIAALFPPANRERLTAMASPPPVPDPDDADLDIDNTSPIAADWLARTATGKPPDRDEIRRWCYRWFPDNHERAERETELLYNGLDDLSRQERHVGAIRSIVQTAATAAGTGTDG